LTKVAVKQFQTDHLLVVDGIVGDKTLDALRCDPVRKLQERLNWTGYGPLVVDGQYGHKTEDAVIRFQKDQHLVVDGLAHCQTKAALVTASVRKTQEALNKLGGKLVVDGILGDETHNAIKKFQTENKLVVDGIFGPKTREALEAALKK